MIPSTTWLPPPPLFLGRRDLMTRSKVSQELLTDRRINWSFEILFRSLYFKILFGVFAPAGKATGCLLSYYLVLLALPDYFEGFNLCKLISCVRAVLLNCYFLLLLVIIKFLFDCIWKTSYCRCFCTLLGYPIPSGEHCEHNSRVRDEGSRHPLSRVKRGGAVKYLDFWNNVRLHRLW
jgi:hypothetical protein